MGLTVNSTGRNAVDTEFCVIRKRPEDKVIALAGNPNVGKSTVFNELTGMNQHTGNWPGKTVATAQGIHTFNGMDYILVDLPGTYSLMAHSAEEEVARDFLLYGGVDAVVIVCDATCLERNLNLVLQTMEIIENVVVCVNLMDEAEKKEIRIDLEALEQELGVPIAGASARSGEGMDRLMERVCAAIGSKPSAPRRIRYLAAIERAVSILEPAMEEAGLPVNTRWLALRLLEGDTPLFEGMERRFDVSLHTDDIQSALEEAGSALEEAGIPREKVKDRIVSCIVLAAEEVAMSAVGCRDCIARGKSDRDRKLDRILTSKATGIPIMLLLLCAVFWITITGANYPSKLLGDGLLWIQDQLTGLFTHMNAPDWLHGALVLGVYRVLAWVVSVMLPPMAIFFPLFTLLEDFGYLPRIAFNLDHHFKKAKACGKQALTMWIG